MKKTLSSVLMTLSVLASLSLAIPVLADTVNVDFESPTYLIGNINAQDSWMKTGAFDAAVVSNSYGFASFGSQSLRTSDSVTSGSFGDQVFAKPLMDSVGETVATAGAFSVGTKQNHFEAQFDIASTQQTVQSGMHVSFSPDRGDGSRMSYLRFDDMADGIHVFFDDVTDEGPLSTVANFNESDIATISRTPHTIKLTLDTLDGPSNDIVKVYIDGVLVKTGTSWEDYYRFDPESVAEQSPRIVKTVIFRESGASNPLNENNGFLIDNLSLSSSNSTNQCGLSQGIYSDTLTVDSTDGHFARPLTFIHPAWTASIPGATWIWSDDPVNDPTVDQIKTFTKDFNIVGEPSDSSLQIASDNSYDVSVNNVAVVGAGCSDTTGATFAAAQTCVIPAAMLHTGVNQIEITVKNWAVPGSDAQGNPAGLLFKLTVNDSCPLPPQPGTIHIYKYVDGVQATSAVTGGVSFPMYTPTYSAPFTLGVGGWFQPSDIDYEASTGTVHPAGFTYSAYEQTDGPLVTSAKECDGIHPYSLQGYSLGNSLSQAESAVKTDVAPVLTINGDQYMIVWNNKCNVVPPIKVHILKYLDGVKAVSANVPGGYQFPMTATWKTANLNGGVSTSGDYVLGNNHGGASDQYGADTASMSAPADYTTSEKTGGSSQVVSSLAECSVGKYLLKGYRTSSVDFASAALAPLTLLAPVFAGISVDQYVIVENSKCPTTGTISGMKYNDLNRNGKKDVGEPGLKGWKIRLILDNDDEDGDDDVVVAIAITDINGNYTFSDVTPGTYEVRETHQKGWKRMSKNPKDIVIVAGSTVVNVDFGNAQKRKEEKEDTDKDDNRSEQSGKNYGNHENKNENHENEGNRRN